MGLLAKLGGERRAVAARALDHPAGRGNLAYRRTSGTHGPAVGEARFHGRSLRHLDWGWLARSSCGSSHPPAIRQRTGRRCTFHETDSLKRSLAKEHIMERDRTIKNAPAAGAARRPRCCPGASIPRPGPALPRAAERYRRVRGNGRFRRAAARRRRLTLTTGMAGAGHPVPVEFRFPSLAGPQA